MTEPAMDIPWQIIPVQNDTSVASNFWSSKNIGIIDRAPCSPTDTNASTSCKSMWKSLTTHNINVQMADIYEENGKSEYH